VAGKKSWVEGEDLPLALDPTLPQPITQVLALGRWQEIQDLHPWITVPAGGGFVWKNE